MEQGVHEKKKIHIVQPIQVSSRQDAPLKGRQTEYRVGHLQGKDLCILIYKYMSILLSLVAAKLTRSARCPATGNYSVLPVVTLPGAEQHSSLACMPVGRAASYGRDHMRPATTGPSAVHYV